MKNIPLDTEILLWAVPVFIALIVIEALIDYREKKDLYERKDFVASISMGLISLLFSGGMKVLALIVYSYIKINFGIFDIGWQWWAWILVFFADDFTFYWHHRLSHEIRVLWAAHVNHHSSQRMNFGTALRQSWAEQFYKYVWWLWLPLIGFEPLMIFIMMSISLIYQFFQHTELVRKFPKPIEFIFNTPSHHRAHHAVNPRYLDQNHAGILIIWDRMFGTFAEEIDEDKPVYGITTNINSFNLLHIASHEFQNLWKDIKNAPTFKDKLKYIFYPPGWSHTGEDQTAKTLRKKYFEQFKQS
jgi:sterol desaturase/sphingolipid hydroxylase (fatty acid hydroxylase superfamily)